MWNPVGSGVSQYPSKHGFADRTDVLHCKKWPREKRELLPEIVVIHIESEAGIGLNWKGRKTPMFGPKATLPTLTWLDRLFLFLDKLSKCGYKSNRKISKGPKKETPSELEQGEIKS
jgi:hypothetical protein